MNFIVNEFSILSPTENKAFNEKFDTRINLVVGEKDSGKSSLVRSMLYTLGCDVKSFDFLNKFPENIYVIDFNIDNDNYILIRKKLKDGKGKNYFKIVKNCREVQTYFDTNGFKDYLNKIFNIQVVIINKDNQETKLYPNHIFLPFYTDQDYSWQTYLSSTFNGISFINNVKKIVLEYFTGSRPNEYYNLQLQKDKLSKKLTELSALIKSKEMIIEENTKNIQIIENIDVNSFKKQYQYILDLYNNLITTEHNLKKELNEKIYKKHSFLEMKNKLDSSIEEVINNELSEECPNCNQTISKTMEENYMLFLTQENLINEREKIVMYLQTLDEEINISMEKIKSLKDKNSDLKTKLDTDGKKIHLSERADSYALSRLNEKLLNEISTLRIQRDKTQNDLNEVEKSLSELNRSNVPNEYKKLMIQAFNVLDIPFEYNNYYVSNLESVKISLSGASKVQAFIAQYLSVYEIASNCNRTVNIPMFIDTFLKDDFNDNEVDKTAKFIFDRLENKHQSFVFISNSKQTLSAISEYKFNEIKLQARESLLTQEYKPIFDKYSKLLIGV